jgi:hypothetical protein
MSLSNFNFLNREVDLYTSARTELDQCSNNIQQTIEENTRTETEAVNNAIKNLNNKIENIIQSDTIKQQRQQIENSQQIMTDSLDKAKQVYFKVCEIIKSKNLGPEKTMQMEQTAYTKIISKFLSPEEVQLFEQLIIMNLV